MIIINTENMNIYEKIAKIADLSGVMKKNKSGFNFKYTTEDEILAAVTAGMKKYNVSLIPSVNPSSLTVTPYSYKKMKKEQEVTVNEIIVSADMTYTWVNNDNPDEKIVVPWVMCGQQDDVSQAMGGAMTYANRYFLLKALQIATIEDDPDNYRSKQKANIEDEAKREIKVINEESLAIATEKSQISEEMKKKVGDICLEYTPKKNPMLIKSIDKAKELNEKLKAL